jgi:hypothetical protein
MTQANSSGIGAIMHALVGQIRGTVFTLTGTAGTTVTVLVPKLHFQV